MRDHAFKTLLQFSTSLKLTTLLLLVALADFFFYGETATGWVCGLFAIVLLFACCLHNRKRLEGHPHAIAFAPPALGLAFALIYDANPLALSMYGVTLSMLTLLMIRPLTRDFRWALLGTPLRLLVSFAQLCRDCVVITLIRKRSRARHGRKALFLRRWLMPLMLSGIFVLLFAEANPVITLFLSAINWDLLLQYLSLPRMLFWFFAASLCWTFLRPARPLPVRRPLYVPAPKPSTPAGLLFNEHSILTALMMFNGLFLIQNLLDVAFLWSGAALPQGMNHAHYAHQGAYPLVATALLAAAFVLIALKPGSVTEQSPRIRALVYAWVGQNVFLVISSMVRLGGYIEEFSLTWLRVAALIWMGLVAAGLLLIVARIYFARSNLWLINANLGALYATLYLCCFLPLGGIIADYNVRHCAEIAGQGARLDMSYLTASVGVEALPALRWYESQHGMSGNGQESIRTLEAQLNLSLSDWRQWTFLKYRLSAPTSQD